MIFTAPILILLLALFVTKSMIVSLILGIISANSIYLFFKKISLFKYTFSCFCSSIIRTITTPSYQYALIFLFVLSLTINILIELKIVESYQKIILSLIKKTKYLLVTILGSSWLFFIDDYLITLSLKNFFSP
jgi:Na+/H+ antiporter NhaC